MIKDNLDTRFNDNLFLKRYCINAVLSQISGGIKKQNKNKRKQKQKTKNRIQE